MLTLPKLDGLWPRFNLPFKVAEASVEKAANCLATAAALPQSSLAAAQRRDR